MQIALDFERIERITERGGFDACAGLTWSSYRPVLEAMESENRLALVALAGETPVALWLSVKTVVDESVECHTLLSVYVAPELRRRGIASRLMKAAEAELASRGVESLTTRYSSLLPNAKAMSGLLQHQSWSEPKADRIRICGRVGDTVSTSRAWDMLLQRLSRRGIRYVSWQDAPVGFLDQAFEMLDLGHAPEWADPRPWCDVLSKEFSLVILDGAGQLSGWVICEPQPKLARFYFPIGWVTPAEQDRGTLVGAYLEGSRRIEGDHGPSALAVLEASPRQGRAWNLFEHHFASFATWSDRLLVSDKTLAPYAAMG